MSRLLILMLTYNEESCVRQALDNLYSQDFKDFDLFVFDNASTDNTYKICREYEDRNNLFLSRNKENIGVINNLINALKVTEEKIGGYDFFSWVCPDDRWNPRFFAKCIEALKLNIGYVASNSYIENIRDNKPLKRTYEVSISPRDGLRYLHAFNLFTLQGRKVKIYDQCIHGVIRAEYVKDIFPIKYMERLSNCEMIYIALMIYYGGIYIVPEFLSDKSMDIVFQERHADDSLTTMLNNRSKISRVMISSRAFRKCIKGSPWSPLVLYLIFGMVYMVVILPILLGVLHSTKKGVRSIYKSFMRLFKNDRTK